MATIVGTPQTTDYGFSAARDAVNLSSGIQANDIIWFVLITANAHTLGTIPAGVNQYGTTQNATGSDSSTSVLYRVATGSEGATFDLGNIYSGAESGGVLSFVMRGLDASSLVNGGNQGTADIAGASGSISGPSVTPTGDGRTVLFIAACDPASSAISATPDSSPVATEIFDGKIDSGNWGYVYAQFYDQPTAGAVSLDADFDYGPLNFSVFQIALNNAQVAVGPDVTLGPDEALVEVTNPVTDATSIFNQLASGTIATGDYVQHDDSANTTVNADGTFTQAVAGSFDARVWDATDETWGQWVTIQVNLPVDEIAPTVSSVSVPTAGSYKAGDTLSFTVNLSEAVDVTGTPQIALNIGGTTRQANYASGTGTSAIVFSYTVQAGDNDPNGIAVSSLGLNGGTIVDQAATPNAANLTLNSIGSTAGVLVDTVKPVITPPSPNPLNIVAGGTFTNTAATAFDSQDGSLGTVAGVHTVDTNTIAQYTVTYPGAGVVDSAGNVADDATRTVNVVAELPEPPVDPSWIFPEDTPSIPVTWSWGKRHPKSGARTRMFKRGGQ